MIIKKKKFEKGKEKLSLATKAFLLLFILAFLVFLIDSNLRLKERREKVFLKTNELVSQLERLKKENEVLKAKIFQKDNLEFLEKEARQRYNLKKPGEEVIVIIEPEKEKIFLSQEAKKIKGFWQNILEFFGF